MKRGYTPDSLDGEHLQALGSDPGYALVRQRIERAINQNLAFLKQAKSWEEAKHLQGSIQAFELVLDMPRQIQEEISKREAGAGR